MTISVSLPGDLERFLKAKVDSGKYSSSSEVVREALYLLRQYEREEADKLEWLRSAWKEGADSGDSGELDFGQIRQEARDRLTGRR